MTNSTHLVHLANSTNSPSSANSARSAHSPSSVNPANSAHPPNPSNPPNLSHENSHMSPHTVPFSSLNRKDVLSELQQADLDLLIIGGGITGAGVLLDAVSRGLRAGLIEMQDFAAGTSSRSTKLVHGGLRYLKQFEVGLVAEVGKERAIVYENAPHVTTPCWMLLPIVEGGTFGRISTSIGISVYDFLAGVKKSERRKMLSKEEALQIEPLLRRKGLKGAGYYVEYRTDDARLTLEVIKRAVQLGGIAINYTRAEDLIYKEGRVVGVVARGLQEAEKFPIYARKIVNATGPWVDELREKDRSKAGKYLHLTKGVHIVIDHGHFPLQNAVYFDVPDGRMIFAIPREGKTYVGTTDTDYQGDLRHPRATRQDIDYLLNAVNGMFEGIQLTPAAVESSWAGVRPLINEAGKSPSEISRKDEVFISKSGLITIAGGKLTGYRKMAQKVVDLVVNDLSNPAAAKIEPSGAGSTGNSPARSRQRARTAPVRTVGAAPVALSPEAALLAYDSPGSRQRVPRPHYTPCHTARIHLSGGDVGGSANFEQFVKSHVEKGVELGLDPATAEKLVRRYGGNIAEVYDRMTKHATDAEMFGIPKEIYASVLYAIECEMCMTLVDFFLRRTSSLLFDIQFVYQWKEKVADLLAQLLHLDEIQLQTQKSLLAEAIEEATITI
jgi:glycerol-3-phosphate dehydrogenase